MNRKIVFIIIIVMGWFIWVGYLKPYNTYINIADYYKGKSNYDIEVIIDGNSVIKDKVDTISYGFFGKIHPTRIGFGRHKIVVESKDLNLKDSTIYYSFTNSVIYIEISDEPYDFSGNILISKINGNKVIYE